MALNLNEMVDARRFLSRQDEDEEALERAERVLDKKRRMDERAGRLQGLLQSESAPANATVAADQTANTTMAPGEGGAPGDGGREYADALPPDVAPMPGQPGQPPQPQQPIPPGGTPPPPPPPPPTPPMTPPTDPTGAGTPPWEFGGTNLGDFAGEWLNNPNRFLQPLAEATRRESELRMAEQERSGKQSIDEWAASRGLLGSSVEGDKVTQLQGELARVRADDDRKLLEMMATAESLDKEAAAQLALDLTEMGQRESQFARSLNLNERQFQQAQFEFGETHAENIASRLQQESQFARSLTEQQATRAMEGSLRSRALDLQEQGMTMDQAFRQAELDLRGEIQRGQLRLTELGMEQDEAYRYAAMEQDSLFRQMAEDRMREGMEMDEAYRYAEQDWKAEQREKDRQHQTSEAQAERDFRKWMQSQDQDFLERMMNEMGINPYTGGTLPRRGVLDRDDIGGGSDPRDGDDEDETYE